MQGDDAEHLPNYSVDTLYVHPAKASTGAYATIVGDSDEVVLSEIDVTSRCKVAVSAFYVKDRADFGTFKIVKLQYHRTYGWRVDSSIQVNSFQLVQLREFVSIISSLDLQDSQKTRISLGNLDLGTLGALLSSGGGSSLLKELAASPALREDIYAVATKRRALEEFKSNLSGNLAEPSWQSFFEQNPWIFGHGLNYVFLDKVGTKLESVTTGNTFERSGKRVDGLMHTRAEVSQYVLVEIKKSTTELLKPTEYRSGCWSVTNELSDAVTQIQKTVHEFARARFRDPTKDEDGNDTGGIIYSVEPKSFLVVGCLSSLKGNDDKITCFELYRRNIRAPEILTFDELYHRARCIVDNLSKVSG